MGDGSRVDGVSILSAARPRFEDLGYPEHILKLNLLLRAGRIAQERATSLNIFLTAFRMFIYPVHLHIFPIKALLTSSMFLIPLVIAAYIVVRSREYNNRTE